jgi:hypothetical protein
VTASASRELRRDAVLKQYARVFQSDEALAAIE